MSRPLDAVDLRVEGQPQPLGLEGTPRFSWRLAAAEGDPGRGRAQSAYRIVVAREGDPLAEGADTVWDSGTVPSAATCDIPYAGAELAPRTRYRWRVRAADETGAWTRWSPERHFETGLGDTALWEAGWIGAPRAPASQHLPSLENLPYVWAAGPLGPSPARTAAFRARFTVPAGARPSAALLVAGGAQVHDVHLNGAPLTGEVRDGAFVADAGDLVVPGENVLAVRAAARDGLPGGLCARLDVALGDRPGLPHPAPAQGEATVTLASGGRWQASDDPAEGFERTGFDDSGWLRADQVGLHGDPPWGREAVADRPSACLRRGFEVRGPVRRARLYATSLGVHELYLGGRRVGDEYFAPGWTDYHHRVTYRTHDVTGLLSEGPEVLGAVLADGWYAGHVGWFGPFRYGTRPALRAELEIVYEDGTADRVRTGPDWQAGEGAVRYADLQNGERQDLAAEPAGWTSPGSGASGWPAAAPVEPPAGRLTSAVAPPVRVHEELSPRAVWEAHPGVWIADFGQNLVGWVRLTARADRDRPVVLRHAEVLDHDGAPYLANLRSARATDEFLPRGGADREVFEPRFTFHGFRYAEISGLAEPLTPDMLTARVAHAAMEPTGTFTCSDERLDRLQRNIVRGQLGNFLSVPTDCPQRDERLGWTGDIWAFAPTALFNYDARAFLDSWLTDVADAQGEDGAVAHVAPDVLSGCGMPSHYKEAGSPGWGDAVVMVPWALHRLRGDLDTAARLYEPMRRWLAYLDACSAGGVFPDHGFGDWLSIGAETPRSLVGTALFALSARQLAELADALGRGEDARTYRELHARVRRVFRDAFLEGPGLVASGTQTAHVLAVAAGLLEEAELPRAGARLAADVEARGGHLSTGFLGTPFLLDALTATGHLDTAYRLLTQDGFPSWLYPVVHGDATTMWERWDGRTDHRGLQDPGMNSFNHYAYGAVGDWMYRTVGGLAPASPGYREVVVRPRPGGGITSARTTHRTVHGPVEVAWRLEGGEFALELVLPPNTRAEVWVPAADPGRVTEGKEPAAGAPGVVLDRVEDGCAVLRVGSGAYAFRS